MTLAQWRIRVLGRVDSPVTFGKNRSKNPGILIEKLLLIFATKSSRKRRQPRCYPQAKILNCDAFGRVPWPYFQQGSARGL